LIGVDTMQKSSVTIILILIYWLLVWSWPEALSQSGRRREPARPAPTQPKEPPPTSTEKPAKPAAEETPTKPVPKGGTVAKREVDSNTATTRFSLENGLTLIVREKYSKPLVAISAYVKVGRFDEPDELLGVNELVKRLLLRGTTTRPGSQALRQLRALGGVVSARTESDHTVYTIVVPADKVKPAVEIQADILQHPAVDADTLSREVECLIQEHRTPPDNLPMQVFRSFLELAFPAHPVTRSPISEQGLHAITREKLIEFYQAHYRPDKVILTVVGAVAPFAVLEPVQQAYGPWVAVEPSPQPQDSKLKTQDSRLRTQDSRPQPSNAKAQTQDASPQKPNTSDQEPRTTDQGQTTSNQQPTTSDAVGLRYGRLEKEISPALAGIGYRIEVSDPADAIKLEMLLTVFGHGRASRLGRAWYKQDVVRDFTMDSLRFKDAGLMWIQLSALPQNMNNAELAFFKEVGRLRRELISPGDVQRVKSVLERRFYDQRARLDQESEALARSEATTGDFGWADRYLTTVRTATSEQLQQLAARYLLLTKAVLYEIQPKQPFSEAVTAETVTKWITTNAPGAGEAEIPASQITQAEAIPVVEQGARRQLEEVTDAVLFSLQPEPIREYSVLQGPPAFVRVDQSLPTISVGLFVQGGRIFEDAGSAGITELMLRAMMKGARAKLENEREAPLSATDLAMRLDQLGAEMFLVNEADFFGFIMHGLSRNQEALVRLLIDILERPAFDEAEVARERAVLMAEIERAQNEGASRSVNLMWSALVGAHPYALPRLGRKESVQNLTAAQLRAWHDKTIGRQYPLVMIVGDTDGSTLISSLIAPAISRRDVQQSFRAAVPKAPDQPRQLVESTGAQVTSQTFGFLGPAGPSPDNEVLQVIEQILSGPGGRLTDGLRDRQAAAYQVHAVSQPGLIVGAFLVQLSTVPEQETRARELVQREIEKFVAEAVGDEEVSVGINAAIGSSAEALQFHPRRVLEYARTFFFSHPPKEVESSQERIRGITKEKIRAVAGSVFKWGQHALGIVRGQVAPPLTTTQQ
jgi:zinc protease